MKTEDFEPDVVIPYDREIAFHLKVYLDDKCQDRCYEIRVKWDSFERAAFGELIVGTERDGREALPILHKPRVGEFDNGNVFVKSVTGQIYIDLDERGKELLGWLKKASQ